MEKYYVLMDIGGTFTKFYVLSLSKENFKIKYRLKKEIKNKDALLNFLKDSLKKFQPLEILIVSLAGPVFNDKYGYMTNWKGNPKISFDTFKKLLKIKKIVFFNDMVVHTLGLLCLKEKKLIQKKSSIIYKPKKIKRDGSRALIIPGTGLGSGILFEDGKVSSLETQHTTFYPRDKITKRIFNSFEKSGIFPSFENFVSGEGLFRIYLHLKRLKNLKEPPIKKIKETGGYVLKKAREKDKEGREALKIYFSVLGIFCQAIALSFKPHSGIFLSGKGIIKNLKFLNKKLIIKNFHFNDKQKKLLKEIPIFYLKEDLIFKGFLYYLEKFVLK